MRGDATRGFLSRHWLLAAASGGAMAEAAVLAALAPAARVLAPQVTALPPLAIYHDLRWLFGYGMSWPLFVLLMLLLLVVRSAFSAGLIRLAWPAGVQPPPLPVLLWSCITLTAFAGLLLSPVVALMFGASVVPFSWPFLASLSAMVLLMLPISHGGVLTSWWETLPPVSAAGWLLADFAVLTVAAVVITRLPVPASVPVAGLAGLVNARCWYGVTAAVTRVTRRAPAHIPLAPLAAMAGIAVVVGATRLAFYLGVQQSRPHRSGAAAPAVAPVTPSVARAQPPAAGPAAITSLSTGDPAWAASARAGRPSHGWSARGRQAVLVLAGFGSSCCNHAGDVHRALPGRLVQQFSYRGLSRTGQPLPQGPTASNLPLTVLGNRVTAQLLHLSKVTGRPVDVVAESEGTLGVDAMLAMHPQVPLGSVVLLSPIVAPGQDSYPRISGGNPGMVAGAELRAVIWFAGGLSPFGTSGAQTFVSSVDSHGAQFAAAAHLRPVRLLQFVPLADAVTLPACKLPANVDVVPAWHGELLGDPSVLQRVRDFLARDPVRRDPGLRGAAETISAGAAAWRMPLLNAPSPPCPS